MKRKYLSFLALCLTFCLSSCDTGIEPNFLDYSPVKVSESQWKNRFKIDTEKIYEYTVTDYLIDREVSNISEYDYHVVAKYIMTSFIDYKNEKVKYVQSFEIIDTSYQSVLSAQDLIVDSVTVYCEKLSENRYISIDKGINNQWHGTEVNAGILSVFFHYDYAYEDIRSYSNSFAYYSFNKVIYAYERIYGIGGQSANPDDFPKVFFPKDNGWSIVNYRQQIPSMSYSCRISEETSIDIPQYVLE